MKPRNAGSKSFKPYKQLRDAFCLTTFFLVVFVEIFILFWPTPKRRNFSIGGRVGCFVLQVYTIWLKLIKSVSVCDFSVLMLTRNAANDQLILFIQFIFTFIFWVPNHLFIVGNVKRHIPLKWNSMYILFHR